MSDRAATIANLREKTLKETEKVASGPRFALFS